jgi:hypothetical protein
LTPISVSDSKHRLRTWVLSWCLDSAHSGNSQGTFEEHSGNIQGTFCTFREHSGNIQHIQGTLGAVAALFRGRSSTYSHQPRMFSLEGIQSGCNGVQRWSRGRSDDYYDN